MEGICHDSEIDSPTTQGGLIEGSPDNANHLAVGNGVGEEFWLDQLAQPPGPPQLPLDYLRPSGHSFRVGRASANLDDETILAVRRMSAAQDCSLFAALLSTFTLLVHRLAAQDDVVVGVHFGSNVREGDGRREPSRVLPLRSHFEDDPRFVDHLEVTDELIRDASRRQELFSSRIIDRLGLAQSSLFSVLFNYEIGGFRSNAARLDAEFIASCFPGADPGFVPIPDLYFNVLETNGGEIQIECDFPVERLKLETVERWLVYFRTLLKNVLKDPGTRVWEIPILSEAERDKLVIEWNRTKTPFPSEASVSELFEIFAAEAPQAPAIEHRDVRWTYGELNERANRLAHTLRDAGAGPESLIGICLERTPEMIAGMLAILKAGSAYVPIDPDSPDERCLQMLENVSLVVSSERFAGKFAGGAVPVLFYDDPRVRDASNANLPLVSDGRSLAYVIYTSGSSGRPKGVAVEHRGVTRLLRDNPKFITFESSDTVAQILNLAFDASVQEVWGALLNGARLVIIDKEIILSPARFVEELKRAGVTILNTPVSLFNLIVSEIPDAFKDLKYVVFGGEMADPRSVAAVLEAGAPQNLVNAYGPTETTVAATALHIKSLPKTAVSVPIGSPICNTTVYVLDRLRNPVPIGVAGEIYIGGPGVARGYLGNLELTEERFVPDPFSTEPDARLYKSGDLGKWLPEGSLEFIGRTDFQIKIRGFRVEPGEIEAILKQYPAVRDAVIEVRDLNALGNQLIAYVAADTSQLSERGIRDFLKASLPRYMVPSAIVLLKELPLNANGKLDRRALHELVSPPSENGSVAPRDPIEEQLVAIWRKALDISSLGVTDDFFELGGHSLTAIRINSEIEKAHGISVSFAMLSEAPTVEKFASLLREQNPELIEYANGAAYFAGSAKARNSIPALGTLYSDIPRATSFAQRRLWFIDQLKPGTCEYNLPFAIRLRGNLNVQALARSFSGLLARHEVLRTTFRAVDGEPIQFVAPPEEMTLRVTDLRGLPKYERASRQRELIEAAAWTPFDLAEGPLFRASLLQIEEHEHVLVFNLHHIIFDHWSDKILIDELIAGYEAYCEGRDPVWPELPIQYADYAHWQRDFLRRREFEEQFRYWRKHLEDLPTLQLPTDHVSTRSQISRGANERFALSPQLTAALKSVGRSERATSFMTVLAAFKILLGRYTGQDDIVVGSPIADRGRAGVAPLIGLFLNTLVLRTKLGGNPTFREVLRRVRRMALEAYRNQDLPFDSLVEALAPKRGLAQNPLFQVAFVLVDNPPGTYPMGDLNCERIEIEDRTAKFDLTLMVLDDPDGLHGTLNYNANLFEAETMRRMASHLSTLLNGIAANPDARIAELPILTAEERKQLLVDWNRTEREFPVKASVSEIFEKQVANTPDAVAIQHDASSVTYRELNERANRVARVLQEAGGGPGSLVPICLDRSLELIVGILAILKAGATYVPINSSYPEERRSLMLEGAAVIMTSAERRPEFERVKVPVIDLENLDLSGVNAENLPSVLHGESTLAILYTSGSTGKPKGVKIVHRSVTALVLNTNYMTLDATDAVAFRANIGFDVALFEIWGPLLNGARLIVVDQEVQLSPAAFVSEMKRFEVTVLWITTSLFHLLAVEMPGAFSSLRRVFVGGEILDPECARAVLEHGPPQRLVNVYGPTEATAFSTTHEFQFVPENARSVPIGKPIANTKIYLLDRDGGLVPIGVQGEIYIGGAGVANGYLNAPELSSARFIRNPFSNDPESRIYRSGDLAKWLPDGSLDFVGRADNQVKIRGFRIELAEIEMVLKQHPSVRDAVVIVQEREGGDKRLVAYVAGEPSELSITEIHDYLKSKLPDYALPSAIVVLEKFPFNSNGKVDRRALPEPAVNTSVKEIVLPRDAVETQLVAIWEKVLKVEPISVTDDFFQLGGHSLMAVRIFLEIERTLGKSFPLATLFGTPTIERLAEKVREEGLVKDWAPLVAVQLQGNRIPFFGIHGRDGNVLFYRKLSECLGKEQPFYALQSEGLDGKPMSRLSIEEMADCYLEEIRKIRPRGPYMIGGYSFGGVAAYEIARRLRLAGEEVILLVLFDSYNPVSPPRLRSVMERIRKRITDPAAFAPTRLVQFVARRIRGRAGAKLLKWNESMHKFTLTRLVKRDPSIALRVLGMHVRMVHERAFFAYRPEPYDGKITLICPVIRPSGYEVDPDLGWRGVALGGVDVYNVPGDHDTMFLDGVVEIVADKLKECIEAATLNHTGRES